MLLHSASKFRVFGHDIDVVNKLGEGYLNNS